MIVSGAIGILFNPDMVYATDNSDGTYDIIAENKECSVTLYENVSKISVENILRRITFQIECQGFKDED